MAATRFDQEANVDLKSIDTDPPSGIDRETVEARLAELQAELTELQELMYGAADHSLLIVLQGMDTSGKDGLIRSLAVPLNVQGVHVKGFKVPTPEELAHDFLWRVHPHTPGKGNVSIFNRSHYEDVLVVRVHNLVPEEVWSQRYGHIRDFEELLAESGTIILKFMLHISKKEQEERLLEREQAAEKSWKLSAGDWKEREHWDDYQKAYEVAIKESARKDAPWLVVPADKKWYRNFLVTEAIVEALRPFKEGWIEKLEKVGVEAKAELAAYRAQG